jgi:transposase
MAMDLQDASTDVAAPMPRMKSPDRSLVDPNPKRIDDLIAPDHEARLIWEFVENLDMTPLLEDIKAVEGHPGRPAIDPKVLVALWMYGTTESISSARKLAKLCCRDDVYKWICGTVKVNYHTLSDFRIDHSEWLEQQVVTSLAAMRKEGLIDLNVVGQDGMRVRASAGSGSFKKEEKLDEFLEEAQQQWDRLQEEFESGSSESSARERAARERAARERLERLQRAKEERKKVEASRERRKKGDGRHARASTTDPETRRMKMPDGGYRPAYNVQFATTLDTLVIVGDDVINAGSDGGQMDPMVERIEQQYGEVPEEYYADGGFSTKDDIDHVGQRGVEVYTPIKEEEKQKREGKDPYGPRRGEGPKVTEWRERMGTEDAKEKYKQRCKCEWSNACCRNWGLWQFTVRGLENVRAVVLWYVLTHNLFRMVALRAERAMTTVTLPTGME